MKVKTFEELEVWQVAMQLAEMVYALQRHLPKEEVYGLGDQLRRAVVSIPSNIADGFGRDSTADFVHFLYIARGSVYETRTQLELARRLGYLEVSQEINDKIVSVSRLLNGLIRSLRPKHQTPTTPHQPPPAKNEI